MTLLQAIVIGAVQGLTEFLPVSSSAHLVLVPWVLGWPAPSIGFDVVAHVGTLVALLAYFWREVRDVLLGFGASLRRVWPGHPRGPWSPRERLPWLLVLASAPAAVAGLWFEDFFEALFLKPETVGGLLAVTGVFLLIAGRARAGVKEAATVGWREALAVGIAQALAIAPGISRSGSTIGTGLLAGLKRDFAPQFAFLLGVPAIMGAAWFQRREILHQAATGGEAAAMVAGGVAAAVVGYLAIVAVMGLVRRGRLSVFGWYCLAVAAASLAWGAFRG